MTKLKPVKGMHLFEVNIVPYAQLWITAHRKDFNVVTSKANKIFSDKESEFHNHRIDSIRYRGTIDA